MRIGIIGFGLMGASLALALRAGRPSLSFSIADLEPRHLAAAREFFPDATVSGDAGKAAEAADIVFLATPVRSMGAIAKTIAPALGKDAILTDLGSVKQQVIADIAPHVPTHCHFIPGHPVAGRERAGPGHADPGIFEGRNWILTPAGDKDPAAVERLEALLSALPLGRIMRMDPKTHDRALAFSSHLPHVIAFAAMLESARLGGRLGINMHEVNGGSYEDMTRVAAADPVMWRDIFLSNAGNIEQEIRALIAGMETMLGAMRAGDGDALFEMITRARDLGTAVKASSRRP